VVEDRQAARSACEVPQEFYSVILSRLFFLFSRLCFALLLFLSASYCLLVYVPFTYQVLIVSAWLGFIMGFAKYHALLYWVVLALTVPTLLPDLRRSATKWLTTGFLGLCAALGVVLVVHPVLRTLTPNNVALYWGLVFLVPLPLLAAIDWLSAGADIKWTAALNEYDRFFRASWESGLFLALLYTGIAYYVHYTDAASANFGAHERSLSAAWTIVCHLLVFMGLFVLLSLVHWAARRFADAAKTEFAVFTALACLLIALIVRNVILPMISFRGTWATAFALAIGVAVGTAFAAATARAFGTAGPEDSGLGLLLRPLSWVRLLPRVAGYGIFGLIALLALYLAISGSHLDWNFLRQKLSALIIWAVTFANFFELAPRREPKPANWLRYATFAAALLVPLGAYEGLRLTQFGSAAAGDANKVNVSDVLGQYAGYDVSFQMLFQGLAPGGGTPEFYKFLVANTNISWSTRTDPVDVELSGQFTPTNLPKPNIFIFVIDSLRRDYLSAFNPAVTFTPNFDAFARESVVFKNAFASYGGTDLSEPSIWAGTMLLHKQYPLPFYPINSLQKMLDGDGYKVYLSLDSVLQMTLKVTPSINQLETSIPGRKFDFCRGLDDLEGQLGSGGRGGQPIFAYAQPQNIHTWTVTHEGESVPPGESYPGFYEPVAARVHYMDECWGKFHQFLKRSGLYDNSIVVVTADHGESLGEEGRWGHGYQMFEEIIRVPLIIHLPPALRSQVYVDENAPAFLTDITPSIYYLLGHRPIVRNGLFGKPLFTQTQQEAAEYQRSSYLLASSYGPVYAILEDNATRLYIADAERKREWFFDLPPDAHAVPRPITPELRAKYEGMIQHDVQAIGQFYHFDSSR
jgi:glucan phosphoethanolaminetransferase (alkaline phosphatase superfamily)